MMSEPDYEALARRLSDALLNVRPLGGSECFTRVGDDFYADPEFCGEEIKRLREELHEFKGKYYSLRGAIVKAAM